MWANGEVHICIEMWTYIHAFCSMYTGHKMKLCTRPDVCIHIYLAKIIVFHHSRFPNRQPPSGDDRRSPGLALKPARGIPSPDILNSVCTPTYVRHTNSSMKFSLNFWWFPLLNHHLGWKLLWTFLFVNPITESYFTKLQSSNPTSLGGSN